MGSTEFEGWPKTPHWFRDIVITEKIDGTNAAVNIVRFDDLSPIEQNDPNILDIVIDTDTYAVLAQSRKRYVTRDADNAGFGAWVYKHAQELLWDLGPGRHFGEWWGQGIQRGYGLAEKRFSLFNTAKWDDANFQTPQLGVVPIMYQGPNDSWAIELALDDLFIGGSFAAPGFLKPEGVVVFHTAANKVFKILLEGDETPKSIKVSA